MEENGVPAPLKTFIATKLNCIFFAKSFNGDESGEIFTDTLCCVVLQVLEEEALSLYNENVNHVSVSNEVEERLADDKEARMSRRRFLNSRIRESGTCLANYLRSCVEKTIIDINYQGKKYEVVVELANKLSDPNSVRDLLHNALKEKNERLILRQKSQYIRNHHKFLREESRQFGVDNVWCSMTESLCGKTSEDRTESVAKGDMMLREYADAMMSLASRSWIRSGY